MCSHCLSLAVAVSRSRDGTTCGSWIFVSYWALYLFSITSVTQYATPEPIVRVKSRPKGMRLWNGGEPRRRWTAGVEMGRGEIRRRKIVRKSIFADKAVNHFVLYWRSLWIDEYLVMFRREASVNLMRLEAVQKAANAISSVIVYIIKADWDSKQKC